MCRSFGVCVCVMWGDCSLAVHGCNAAPALVLVLVNKKVLQPLLTGSGLVGCDLVPTGLG